MGSTKNTVATEAILKALNYTLDLCANEMTTIYEITFMAQFQQSPEYEEIWKKLSINAQHSLHLPEYYYICPKSPGVPFFLTHLKSECNEIVYDAYHAAKELLTVWPNRQHSQLLEMFAAFYRKYIPKSFAKTPLYCLKNTDAEKLLNNAFMKYCLSFSMRDCHSMSTKRIDFLVSGGGQKCGDTTSPRFKRRCSAGARPDETIRYRFGIDPTGDKTFRRFLEDGKRRALSPQA